MKDDDDDIQYSYADLQAAVLAERDRCIDIIEHYQIHVGGSAAGEVACEMTYMALRDIRDEIKGREMNDMSTKPQNVNTSAEHVHEIDKSVHEQEKMCVSCGRPTMHMGAKCYGCCQTAQPEQEPELVGVIGNWGRVEWADGVYPQMGDRLYSAPPSKPEEKNT